jgi:CRP-like cAMP-binding protein
VTDKVEFLSRLNLFEGMAHEEVEDISRELRMTRHPRGAVILDAEGDRVYLLKEGRVRLYHVTPDGHEVTTAVLRPGQMFGLAALFGRDEEAIAACLDDCLVCDAGAHDFLAILARHPLMLAKVMMAMAKQIFHLQQTIEHLAAEPVRSRLARHLLGLAEGGMTGDEGCLLPPATQEDLAQVVSATRETVARTLGVWRRQRIIEMQGRRIVLRDIQRLRAEIADDVDIE